MLEDIIDYTSKNIYFLRNLTISTGAVVGLSPFLNACTFVSTQCMIDGKGPRDAMRQITNNWKTPSALLDGVKQTTMQQVVKSFVRNGIWFKKAELDEAFPETSKYIIPAFFAGTEMLLNPSMVKRTKIQVSGKALVNQGERFLGVLPGVLKVAATTGIYVQVKPYVDEGMRACDINPDSVLGACVSAAPIAIPVTLLAHPLERIRTKMQLPPASSTHRLGFFEESAALLKACNVLRQEEGLKPAVRFVLRGWQPALMATTVFTVAFNLMILAGKQYVEESLSQNLPKTPEIR